MDEKPLFDGPVPLTKERDACGVGFIASQKGGRMGDHSVVEQGLGALGCMEHRGACGGDGITGDGAGVMTGIPWHMPGFTEFVTEKCARPGVAQMFLPRDKEKRDKVMALLEKVCMESGEMNVLGWRKVPTDPSILGAAAYRTRPSVWQLFVSAPTRLSDQDDCRPARDGFERSLYLLRRRFEALRKQQGLDWPDMLGQDVYFASFSSRTIVYKGMVQSSALAKFYPDLRHPLYTSKFIIYHRRFSTNTVPRWPLAQPMRKLGHNGEINTLLGNLNWQRAREAARARVDSAGDIKQQGAGVPDVVKSGVEKDMVDFDSSDDIVTWTGDKVEQLEPIVSPDRSDSANLDSVFEQMCLARHRAACALMSLVPAAYDQNPIYEQHPEIIDFYEYHGSILSDAWDGPALLVFSDGKTLGASLDRNGLRPARYHVQKDGTVCMMSETGVVPVDEANIVSKGRLGPGDMISLDLDTGEFKTNIEIKTEIASRHPYGEWLAKNQQVIKPLQCATEREFSDQDLVFAQASFGWGLEDIGMQIRDMAGEKKETIYSMGDDAPLAVLSEKTHVLYNYFKQRFAQVTNPPIDPLREGVVMSLKMTLGKKGVNIYKASADNARVIVLESPVLNEAQMQQIRDMSSSDKGGFQSATLSTRYPINSALDGLKAAIHALCDAAVRQVEQGTEVLVLSDRTTGEGLHDSTYIPPLMAVGAVHHRLIEEGLRMNTGLVVETGAAWSTHHFACLYGYGAHAVHPYLAFDTIRSWHASKSTQTAMQKGNIPTTTVDVAQANFIYAVEKGLLKILSKIGISLLSSYHGAQIFEAIGLSDEVIGTSFIGTPSRVGGMTLRDIAAETVRMRPDGAIEKLENPGFYKPAKGQEYHANSIELAQQLHKAVGLNVRAVGAKREELGGAGPSVANYEIFKQSLATAPLANLRDLMDFKSDRPSIPIEQVEPVEEIMKRFCTGAMSLGALSREAHEALAIAMNRIGGKSNSGEGGEDILRGFPINDVDENGKSETFPHLYGLKNGDSANSAVHQVASGRFGVTPEFLVTGNQLEIKIAQGAKPGEGGQLPGPKVSEYIARLRSSKEGVTLISPPPHHDIYSIEDLAQLIHDLHAINDKAPVSVKLVSCVGIGTVACGVAKANADVIQISGGDGGTGASPLSSIKYAGGPWELGLAETHASLLMNGLRERVLLRVDGGVRTGRDVMVAALLGAEEFGFGTIAMIAEGCVMARVCHTNKCPTGVTSQKEELRKKFPGTPEHVVNFFEFVAEEIREMLAHMGYTRLTDVIGRADLLEGDNAQKGRVAKTESLDVNKLLKSLPCADPDEPCNIDPAWLTMRATRDPSVLPAHPNGSSSELDRTIAAQSDVRRVIEENAGYVRVERAIRNTDRSVGGFINGDIARAHGNTGFKGEMDIVFRGSAGQSFGCFNLDGVTMKVIGEANDYVGKSMNGGQLVVVPTEDAGFEVSDSSIVGNACLYGATGGHFSAVGRSGERFCVRNSGVNAVVEGAGDHCCEYMTGGVVVVLGSVGRNVAAGMTGGIAYLLDTDGDFMAKLNGETVTAQRIQTEEGRQQLLELLQKHVALTGSVKAKSLLEGWPAAAGQFWQLFPAAEAKTPQVVQVERASSPVDSILSADSVVSADRAPSPTVQLPSQ